ncbi:hypothetical protein [Legionella maceachernii]|uniref:Uncharacterized protein n=1 Tax=Legionella maceachernii TaxID=466 RepID=A0A0W0W3R2_9GAMM|nr:hypothetical protein [Legionella maceachernii]KTD27000.1 hypothetical protein Lmac_1248 [Legionella maceachernii]SKA02865.1 hypothetical protein SAMN02745128_01806 [Legionella maceachernii]SUP00134.1 Uncharacterised protein [Legionella maceachernii]
MNDTAVFFYYNSAISIVGAKMIIAVFSIGQFISSDVQKLKDGFTQYFASRNPEITGQKIWDWMVPNLKPLRVADITLEQFCENLNQHFKVQMSFADFQAIFNSMAQVNEESLKRISEFKALLEANKDIQILLVSHTNYSHFNFVLKQIGERLPPFGIISAKNDWPKDAQILFVPSMHSKCPEHPDTLKYALTKLEVGPEIPLVSFLNTILQFEGHPHFRYINAGAVLNPQAIMAQLGEVRAEIVGPESKEGKEVTIRLFSH